jgi:hypothetical protein
MKELAESNPPAALPQAAAKNGRWRTVRADEPAWQAEKPLLSWHPEHHGPHDRFKSANV